MSIFIKKIPILFVVINIDLSKKTHTIHDWFLDEMSEFYCTDLCLWLLSGETGDEALLNKWSNEEYSV